MADTTQKNILDALELEGLTPAEQEEILLDVNELVFQGALVRLIERMDDTTRTDFEALMDAEASEGEVEAFLEKRVPGSDTVLTETLAELTDDILAATK